MLALRYMYPCIEMRKKWDLVSRKDAREVSGLLYGRKDICHELLNRCFSNAVLAFGEFAGIDPLGKDPWLVEQVRIFWREHKGRSPSCDVKQGVVEIVKGNVVRVHVGTKIAHIINRYSLPVKLGDIVFFHHHIIAEVEESSL